MLELYLYNASASHSLCQFPTPIFPHLNFPDPRPMRQDEQFCPLCPWFLLGPNIILQNRQNNIFIDFPKQHIISCLMQSTNACICFTCIMCIPNAVALCVLIWYLCTGDAQGGNDIGNRQWLIVTCIWYVMWIIFAFVV